MRRLGRILTVLAMALWLGGHWLVLQSIAWTTMAVGNSKVLPLRSALATTFDGKHPCQICKFVAQGKKSEQKKDAEQSAPKFEYLPVDEIRPAGTLEPYLRPAFVNTLFNLAKDAPPTPPPNSLQS